MSTRGRGRVAAIGDLIKVLIIDDNAIDAELSLMQLRRGGLSTECVIASDETELRAALPIFAPNVILCDFSFPDFDGMAAQRIVREVYPDTPLIFVSGSISEDRAVLALQNGAVDYVLKSNLLRLPSAVQRAVGEAEKRKQLEVSLESSEERAHRQAERLEALWRVANNPTLRGEELVLATLHEAAAAMRPGHATIGVLRHVEGTEYIVDAVTGDLGPDDGPVRQLLLAGTRTAFSDTLYNRDPQGGRTQSWDDVQILENLPTHARAVGWRSLIATQFVAAESVYMLTLGSLEPPSGSPFGAEDHAYTEILGSVFARRLELDRLEDSLRDAELRSRQQAERLEALWRIANHPNLRDEQLWLAMLGQAAAAIRPGQGYRGMLWRV